MTHVALLKLTFEGAGGVLEVLVWSPSWPHLLSLFPLALPSLLPVPPFSPLPLPASSHLGARTRV